MRNLILIVGMLVACSTANAGSEANQHTKFFEQQRQLVEEARIAEEKIKSNPASALYDSKKMSSSPEDDKPKKIIENLINRQKAEEARNAESVEERKKAEEKVKFSPDRMLADAKTAIEASKDTEAKRILDDLMKRHPNTKEHKEAALLLKAVSARILSSSSTSFTSTTSSESTFLGYQWSYSNKDDSMSKGKIYYASVKSTNSLNLDFPYYGTQQATLELRDHHRYGKDVIFQLEKGQIVCSSYSSCQITVRFDDGEPMQYQASGPSDGSTETLFIDDFSGFLGKMQKSKRVRIAVTMFREGTKLLEFDVSDFNPKKFRPK